MKKYSSIANEIIAGALSGFVIVIIVTAVAALIFKGPLVQYFPIGISCIALGALIVNFTTACFGSISYSIARPEPAVAAVFSIMFTNLASIPMSKSALIITIITVFMLVSVLVGVFMFCLGYFKLGQIARFLPYPVLGGVIVGSACIIARSSFHLIGNNLTVVESLFEPNTLLQLSIAVIFALVLIVNKRSCILPISVLCASILVNCYLYFEYSSTEEAIQAGWLFTSFKSRFEFNAIDWSMLKLINWNAIVFQIGYIASIVGLIVIILLLNISALETIEKFTADLDKELKITGVSNVIAGLFCAFPCNISLSGTILNKSIGGVSSISGVLASVICLIVFVVYPHVISFMPIPIIGGLLFYLAFKLMIEWLYFGWKKLSHIDYLIVMLIGFIIVAWNFLPGTFVGIIITCIVFVVHYAKIDSIKFATSGKYYHSNVNRPLFEQQWLVEHGDKIRLFKLQGYLFFGSTKLLLDSINQLISRKADRVQFLIFDFQLVNGFDSSATLSWVRLYQLSKPYKLYLIFTHCTDYFIHQLKQQIPLDEFNTIRFFSDIDKALEWCEQLILKNILETQKPEDTSIESLLQQIMPDKNQRNLFIASLEQFELTSGAYLFRQGDESNSLYFIESGEVSIYLEAYNREIRLSKSGPGTIVGEIGFYLSARRSASVIADTQCSVYMLRREKMMQLEQIHPEVILIFNKIIIETLASRLTQANYLLDITGFS